MKIRSNPRVFRIGELLDRPHLDDVVTLPGDTTGVGRAVVLYLGADDFRARIVGRQPETIGALTLIISNRSTHTVRIATPSGTADYRTFRCIRLCASTAGTTRIHRVAQARRTGNGTVYIAMVLGAFQAVTLARPVLAARLHA